MKNCREKVTRDVMRSLIDAKYMEESLFCEALLLILVIELLQFSFVDGFL